MSGLLRILVLAVSVSMSPAAAQAVENRGVVVSIKPIHSLVAAVMEGAGAPHLIVSGGGSPHTYALKPSDAEALENAKVVFWVGEGMESFLEKSIETLAEDAKVVELIEAHDLKTLPFRESGPFEARDEDRHDEKGEHAEKHDSDGHKDEHAEKHAGNHREGKHADAHDHDGHAHGETDMHIWLDPENAKTIVHEIEEALAEADPANADTYKANAEVLRGKLEALDAEAEATLAPVKDRPFVVFHDGYQYFEERYGLKAAGSITVSPEQLPGAKRIAEIKAHVKELGATCVFAEPQFEPKLIRVVTEGTAARAGVLDPLGSDLPDGPDLYFTLMRNMANAMKDCLSPGS